MTRDAGRELRQSIDDVRKRMMGMRGEWIKQLYREWIGRREQGMWKEMRAKKEVVTKGGKDEDCKVKRMKENSEAKIKDG